MRHAEVRVDGHRCERNRLATLTIRIANSSSLRHVIAGLHRALPQPFPRAAASILSAVHRDRATGASSLRGFAAWPLIDYIGEHGVGHPDIALEALRELTELFSAEFAIRPFLIQHRVVRPDAQRGAV